MRLKYVIAKDNRDDSLVIQELGELDKDEMVLYCEVKYDTKEIKAALDMPDASDEETFAEVRKRKDVF